MRHLECEAFRVECGRHLLFRFRLVEDIDAVPRIQLDGGSAETVQAPPS